MTIAIDIVTVEVIHLGLQNQKRLCIAINDLLTNICPAC